MAAGELFGAPIGIQAAEETARENVLTAVKAQELLGRIAAQPGEMALTQGKILAQPGERALTAAQTEHYTAEAAQKLEALALLRTQNKLAQDFADHEKKVAPIVNAAASQGRIATADDVIKADTSQENPNVSRLQRYLKFAEDRGVSEATLTPLRKELSTILMQDGSAAHSNAQALEQNTRAAGLRSKQIAAWIAGVQKNPEMYPQALAEALNSADPLIRQTASKLPTTYNAGLIERMRRAGIDADKQQELELKTAEDKSQKTLRDAQAAQARAGTSLAEKRAKLIGIQADAAEREFGPGSTQTKDLKAARIDAIRGVTAAKAAEKFPAAPADPKQWITGKSYTAPNGKRFTVTGKDDKGEPFAEWLSDRLKKNISETAGQGD